MSGLNVLNETQPKKPLQQPLVDLIANNMAWSLEKEQEKE